MDYSKIMWSLQAKKNSRLISFKPLAIIFVILYLSNEIASTNTTTTRTNRAQQDTLTDLYGLTLKVLKLKFITIGMINSVERMARATINSNLEALESVLIRMYMFLDLFGTPDPTEASTSHQRASDRSISELHRILMQTLHAVEACGRGNASDVCLDAGQFSNLRESLVQTLSTLRLYERTNPSSSRTFNERNSISNNALLEEQILNLMRSLSMPGGSCFTPERRYKRDVTNYGDNPVYMITTYNTSGSSKLNYSLIKTLMMEHKRELTSKNPSFTDLIERESRNPRSTVGKIWHEACNKPNSKNYYYYSLEDQNQDVNVVIGDQNHSNDLFFDSDEKSLSQCIMDYRLFHCGEKYERTGIVETISKSIATRFSGKIKARKNFGKEVKKIIVAFRKDNPKLPVEYVREATKQALLSCSGIKIQSPLNCPAYDIKLLGSVMLAWFNVPIKNTAKYRG